MLTLDSSISQIPRIGEKYAKKFEKLGLETVRDLLFHFPHRYEDFSNVLPISELSINQKATIQGEVLSIKNNRTWRRKLTITEALIKDKTGTIKATWFNQPFLEKSLAPGTKVSLSGKLTKKKSSLFFSNPSYEIISTHRDLTHTAGLIPIYPETAGLSSKLIRYLQKIITPLIETVDDYLPDKIVKKEKLIPLSQALKEIHFPQSVASADSARQRLAFDELFLIQLSVLRQKQKLAQKRAKIIPFKEDLIKSFVTRLPFTLTKDQKIAAWTILQDLGRSVPMNRLLSGDVGSGKTVVAAMAVLAAVKANSQTALMAPTEVLAQQHFASFGQLLKGFRVNLALLTSTDARLNRKTIKKTELIKKIADGQVDLLIGTHALIQPKIIFNNLALAIIDEQHRFGVKQRAVFQEKILKIKDKTPKIVPHFLTLTATPIPRTLALTIYGDLDISILREKPKNRKEIITKIVSARDRSQAYQFIHQQVKSGRQVFVICPLVEESIKLSAVGRETKAVKSEYKKLNDEVFPDLKIAMLHGQMKNKEKIMKEFQAGQTSILISTSVVEVGIDVPNATVMMIEGAERFGLAQLHQFRGRVGRGKYQSYCFLFSDHPTAKTNNRLKALLTAKSGFELAEKDLAIRGAGQLYGLRQSGFPDLAMSNLGNVELIEKIRHQANNLLAEDAELKFYPKLRQKLTKFNQTIHLE